ncbi:MAG: VWA domain-containing protein [Candidatus Parabeggiatoa sp. nov. 1]|nr:MAG: VWA domain-containing protein [Gammaproteobacteria bacterium]HEC85163.1 VWA domain-containing protein [Thioploca sp.]
MTSFLKCSVARLIHVGILLTIIGSPAVWGAQTIDLVFTYGSEKQKWLADVTTQFNQHRFRTRSGKQIQVQAIPMGSGKAIQEIASGERKAHLTSPASAAFIELGNAESRTKHGKQLVGPTKNLVLSPVVIAMWKPMAEALGWGEEPIGWAEVLNMTDHPDGWAAYDYPEWGQFKFGHTHPKHSNTGLLSLLAEVYAGAGKTKRLTLSDVNNPDTHHYVQAIEKAVVHYGSSTGFFGRKMFANGPEFLSAAVLYENMVIESYSSKYDLPFPIVAVYPKEGTFWSDHPVGIVERSWVTAEHRKAAEIYINYLLAKPQQEKAMSYGFRPANTRIPLAAPFDAAHGVDPDEPNTLLKVPSAEIINAILALWQARKKPANIVLVIDISGSMKGQKINNARKGALEMLAVMGDADTFSMLAFNNRIMWPVKGISLETKRKRAERKIKTWFAAGGTALYDAIADAHQYLSDNPTPDMIAALVVLSDGEDTSSRLKLDKLLN